MRGEKYISYKFDAIVNYLLIPLGTRLHFIKEWWKKSMHQISSHFIKHNRSCVMTIHGIVGLRSIIPSKNPIWANYVLYLTESNCHIKFRSPYGMQMYLKLRHTNWWKSKKPHREWAWQKYLCKILDLCMICKIVYCFRNMQYLLHYIETQYKFLTLKI